MKKLLKGAFFTLLSLLWLGPLYVVLAGAFKSSAALQSSPFSLPLGEDFVGMANFVKGLTFGSYPFLRSAFYSFFVTLASTALLLLGASMTAYYLVRSGSRVAKGIYLMLVFSMVVPFQMVMFTLSKTADSLGLDSPYTLPIVYLGFGSGLAVFLFTGFFKSLPHALEEAAAMDGCGPIRRFFLVVLPITRPTIISVAVLEIMWIWNDYLLPYLVLDPTRYKTIPIHIQYLRGSYGSVDLGATMALILLTVLPVVLFYLFGQKYIIRGVTAGAVKG